MADVENPIITEIGANNTAPPPDGLPAFSSPNAVYPDWRELAAMSKRWWNRSNPTVTSGGSANAQTIAFGVAPTQGYVLGQRYAFIAGFANTGAMTINVNGLGAKNVQVAGAALVGGEVKVGQIVELAYDGTQFQILSGSGYLPLAGGTLSGNLAVAPTAAAPASTTVTAPAGQGAYYYLGVTGSKQWTMNVGPGGNFNIIDITDSPGTAYVTILSTGAVVIKGTNTNDSAAAGYVGEYISSAVVGGSAVVLTTATNANITSISLTAGDWDVSGEAWFSIGAGGATSVIAALTTNSAAIPGNPGVGSARSQIAGTLPAAGVPILSLATTRLSLATTTTVYLTTQVTFPSGTTTAYGRIAARRVR